jgi:antitoxin (DNA-binding transcriptional repressor) of toxin-antitoxin stability system
LEWKFGTEPDTIDDRGLSNDFGGQPMQTMTIQEAQSHLAEIIDQMPSGEEVILTRDGKPVATLRSTPSMQPPQQPRELGALRGSVLYIAPDFDAIPEGFEEYVT